MPELYFVVELYNDHPTDNEIMRARSHPVANREHADRQARSRAMEHPSRAYGVFGGKLLSTVRADVNVKSEEVK